MNVVNKTFSLTVEKRQAEECLMGIFHTVLFRRCQPKMLFTEKKQVFARGDLGIQNVRCEYVDTVYRRCSSEGLHENLKTLVKKCMAEVYSRENIEEAEIKLLFYRKPIGWFSALSYWEEWVVQFRFTSCRNEKERQESRITAGQALSSAIRGITFAISGMGERHMPEFTDQQDVANIYDMQYDDVTPYLHEVSYSFPSTGEGTAATLGGTLGRLVRSTLAYNT